MTIDQNQSAVETCRTCGQLLDISAMSPLSVAACPVCTTSTVVLRRLGPFQLERLIGQGGMGMVYQAQDLALKRSVAIKVLHRSWSHDQTLTAQFEHEAAMTARINHPNVVRVYSTGTSHGMFYIAMELVDHGSLDSWMNKSGRIPEADLLHLAIQVADGLQAAYRAGLIHRDIKPGNILFAENQLAKIVDFGLALHSSEDAKSNGEIWGTPDYIAPEALAAKHEDFRSDMYALGATLWHALTGKPPHETDSTSIAELLEVKKRPTDFAKLAPSVHPLTVAALSKTLEFRVEDRYPDYDSFISALHLALDALDPEKRHASSRKKKPVPLWIPFTVGALILGSLGAAGIWKARRIQEQRAVPANEAYVSDETRLHSANILLAEGKIDESIPLFELILRSPDLSPKLTAWCKVSLATAYTIQGKFALRAPILQSLSMTDIPNETPLTSFIRSLPGVTPGTKWKSDPDAARDALQQLWIGLYYIANKNWTAAKAPLMAASQFESTGWGEPEAVALLPLAKLALQDLETFKNLEIKIALASSRKDMAEVLRDIETNSLSGILINPVRAGILEVIAQTKTAGKKPPEPTPQPSVPAPVSSPAATTAAAATTPIQPPSLKNDSIAKQRFDILRKETAEMVGLFRFQAATKRVGDFVSDYPDYASRANILIHQIRSCSLLFEWAVRDIQTSQNPLPNPMLRSGVAFPARPVRADNATIFLQSEYGSTTTIEWKEISPIFLLTLATHALPTLSSPAARAELLWYAGNFQFVLGATEKGLVTLKQAAELNPSYVEAFRAISEL